MSIWWTLLCCGTTFLILILAGVFKKKDKDG